MLAATRVHEDVYDRSVDVQILRLRRKLEVDPSTPELIRTERGRDTSLPCRSRSPEAGSVMDRRVRRGAVANRPGVLLSS